MNITYFYSIVNTRMSAVPDRELKANEAMEQLGLKRNTFYNLIKQYEEGN
jgi:predicted DNA-binding transcriptional regulator AlpA